MSTNSERIAANNTRLSALVETAESLPDAGSVEMCNVTITLTQKGALTKYITADAIGVCYINVEGELVLSNNITLIGDKTLGAMSNGISITVTCRCGTPLSFINGTCVITSWDNSEEIEQVLHVTGGSNMAVTIMTPAVTGAYTLNLYY